MTLCWLDIETRNVLDLRHTNIYRYVEHPSFQILMCAYAIDDAPVKVAVGPLQLMEEIEPLLADPGLIFVAHNAVTERVAFSQYLGLPVGQYLPPDRWQDTMVQAAIESYPQSLSKLAKALKVTPKDSAGTRLINLFCKPNRKGEWNTPQTHPEEWQQFIRYCANDVETMREAGKLLPPVPSAEHQVWLADQLINDRGVVVDLPMAEAAVLAAADNKVAARAEVIELTGVENPGSIQQLMAWLNDQGCTVTDLTKDTVSAMLDEPQSAGVRRVLELRQELALSASAKYDAAVNMINADGRLRGQARYYGAHTGRWAGRGLQLQNLPRLGLGPLQPLAIIDLMSGFGASPNALKALIRPLLLGPLTVVDFSAIEARVTAWLAGEKWMLDEFRGDGKIYERTAERMGIADPYGAGRQKGKVASLSMGFAGGVGALRRMGAQGTDAELDKLKNDWRRASPKIVKFWYDLWDAFRYGGTAGPLTVYASKGIRRVELPSGREIVYRGVRRRIDPVKGKPYLSFSHPTGKQPRLWVGVIVENAVQGIARDLLAYALPKLEDLGVPVVAHVHDEVIADGNYLEQINAVLTEVPPWAAGLPLDAEGDIKMRYSK